MASANQIFVFRDGGSNNKPPLFCCEYFDFWKIRMKAHLEAQGEEIWDAIENGPFIPITVINGAGSSKLKLHGMKMIRKRSFMIKRQPIFFKVHLAWMNSSVFRHAKR